MTGYERLDNLVQGQMDQALLKVVEHLKNLEGIEDLFLNEEKDLKGMCDYVKSKAKELAVNNVAVVEDDIVYQWSETYWEQSNETLGIKKKEEARPIPKVNNNVVTNVPKPNPEQAQLTLF